MTGYRRIVLTGGIGSGKSYVADRLAARGWHVIEADRIGHAVLEPGGAAYDEVAAAWPDTVRNGVIDRAALATVVFSDTEELRRLEAITHPAIRRTLLRLVDEAEAPVVVEIPLLRDWFAGWPVIVVTAPEPVRRERLLRRGMEDDDISRRMANQPTDAQWSAAADFEVVNLDASSVDAALDRLEDFLDGFSVTDRR